jgi:hypothetical protein
LNGVIEMAIVKCAVDIDGLISEATIAPALVRFAPHLKGADGSIAEQSREL